MALGDVLDALGFVEGAVPLPTDARFDQAFATQIAGDPVKRQKAYEYWQARFADVGENPFGAADSPALRLGAQLPDEDLATLVPGRAHLTDANDALNMVKRAGCLVSLEEIAKAIDPAGTAASLLADVRAVATAATGPAGAAVDVAQVARGIRGCRELYDAGRRLEMCRAIASGTGLTLSEVLAIYRQEGALAVTPAQLSYAHAPLIATRLGTCRTPAISLIGGGSRPGFSLVYPLGSVTKVAENDVARRFDAMWRNVVTVGGLDTIVFPRLPANDELVLFLEAARAAVPRPAAIDHVNTALLDKLWSTGSSPLGVNQRGLGVSMLRGLMMEDLEDGPARPADELLERVALRAGELIASHPVEQKTRGAQRDNHLLGTLDASETMWALTLQGSWYASRTQWHTLAAREDRTAALRAAGRMSPFLSYLRFHSGDALFMGILLRAIAHLDAILARWTAHPAWGNALPAALAAASWDSTEAAALGGLVNSHWRPKVGTQEAWRHIGLVAEIAAAGAAPAWLPAVRTGATLATTAQVAKRALDAVVDQGLVEPLHAALSLTPTTTLTALGIVPAAGLRLVLAKAQSFERQRLAYDAAMTAVGL